jgi:hypothetical protein
MKQILKREDVAQAVATLTSQNKKPTLAAIHAALGGKGSLSTLVRLKGELEVAKPMIDAPEAEQAFRTVWGMAVDYGRKEQEAKFAELSDDLKAIATENERLDGIAVSARNRVAELEALLARAEADRQTAQLPAANSRSPKPRSSREGAVAWGLGWRNMGTAE